MSLAVAILVATAFATFGFPFNHLQAWCSWARVRAVGILVIYFVLAGVGGGGLGWLIGSVIQVQISSNLAVKGALYGLLGALAVRADFRSRRVPAETRDAASILTMGIEWTRHALDALTNRAAREWLAERDRDELSHLAYTAAGEMRVKLTQRNRETQLALVTPAIEGLEDADSPKRQESRALLQAYLATYYERERLPKPSVIKWRDPTESGQIAGSSQQPETP